MIGNIQNKVIFPLKYPEKVWVSLVVPKKKSYDKYIEKYCSFSKVYKKQLF